MKPRRAVGTPEQIAALEQELSGLDIALDHAMFRVQHEELEKRRQEILGQLKRLR